MALPPCHMTVQFYVRDEIIGNDKYLRYLDCQLYQRSGDMFLGVPFNIASYSVLVYIICKILNYIPGNLFILIGDSHIYNNNIDAVKKQLENTPRPFPKLRINTSHIKNNEDILDNIKLNDFILENYNNCGYIRAPMAL